MIFICFTTVLLPDSPAPKDGGKKVGYLLIKITVSDIQVTLEAYVSQETDNQYSDDVKLLLGMVWVDGFKL